MSGRLGTQKYSLQRSTYLYCTSVPVRRTYATLPFQMCTVDWFN